LKYINAMKPATSCQDKRLAMDLKAEPATAVKNMK
jgi:hypothetical protein